MLTTYHQPKKNQVRFNNVTPNTLHNLALKFNNYFDQEKNKELKRFKTADLIKAYLNKKNIRFTTVYSENKIFVEKQKLTSDT